MAKSEPQPEKLPDIPNLVEGKHSSSEMSSIAARYIKISREDIELILASEGDDDTKLIQEIRSLAASVLSQDETKGQE
jgi:hypothetical protein